MSSIIKAADAYLKRFRTDTGNGEIVLGKQEFHPTIQGGLNLAETLPLAPKAQKVAESWKQVGQLEAVNYLAGKTNQGLGKAVAATKGLMKQGERRADLLAQLGIAALQHGVNMESTSEHLSGWQSAWNTSEKELEGA